jgi:Tol biopolymer transport system component
MPEERPAAPSSIAMANAICPSRRVTFDRASEDDAAWTSDGQALTYWSDRNGKYGIYETRLGSSAESLVYQSSTPIYLGDWSRDGKYLLTHNVRSILALP